MPHKRFALILLAVLVAAAMSVAALGGFGPAALATTSLLAMVLAVLLLRARSR